MKNAFSFVRLKVTVPACDILHRGKSRANGLRFIPRQTGSSSIILVMKFAVSRYRYRDPLPAQYHHFICGAHPLPNLVYRVLDFLEFVVMEVTVRHGRFKSFLKIVDLHLIDFNLFNKNFSLQCRINVALILLTIGKRRFSLGRQFPTKRKAECRGIAQTPSCIQA